MEQEIELSNQDIRTLIEFFDLLAEIERDNG
jgi:hypothetical protein